MSCVKHGSLNNKSEQLFPCFKLLSFHKNSDFQNVTENFHFFDQLFPSLLENFPELSLFQGGLISNFWIKLELTIDLDFLLTIKTQLEYSFTLYRLLSPLSSLSFIQPKLRTACRYKQCYVSWGCFHIFKTVTTGFCLTCPLSLMINIEIRNYSCIFHC